MLCILTRTNKRNIGYLNCSPFPHRNGLRSIPIFLYRKISHMLRHSSSFPKRVGNRPPLFGSPASYDAFCFHIGQRFAVAATFLRVKRLRRRCLFRNLCFDDADKLRCGYLLHQGLHRFGRCKALRKGGGASGTAAI